MAATYQDVRQLAKELPLEQRVMLANDLLETAGPDSFTGNDEAWDAEIERRVAEIQAGTAPSCSVAEFEADLRSITRS